MRLYIERGNSDETGSEHQDDEWKKWWSEPMVDISGDEGHILWWELPCDMYDDASKAWEKSVRTGRCEEECTKKSFIVLFFEQTREFNKIVGGERKILSRSKS